MSIRTRIILSLGVILLIPLISPLFIPQESRNAKLIIRFDDYGIWCSEDWVKLEKVLLDLHEQYGVNISFSVVPDPIYQVCYHPKSLRIYPPLSQNKKDRDNRYPLTKDSDRVRWLKEANRKGYAEIGQHGYHHPKFYSNIKNTEFYGVDYDEQFYKISNGKRILDSLFDINTQMFVPPHNSYDNLTLDFLTELGFTVLSAKMPDYDAPQDNTIPLLYIPCTTESFESVYKYLENNNGLVNDQAPTEVLLIHHTTFTNSEGVVDKSKINKYEELLHYIKTHNVETFKLSDAINNGEILSNNNCNKYHIYKKLSRISETYAANIVGINIGYKWLVFLINLLIILISSCFAYLLFSLTKLKLLYRFKIIFKVLFLLFFVIVVIWSVKLALLGFDYACPIYISNPYWLLLIIMGGLLGAISALSSKAIIDSQNSSENNKYNNQIQE